jgi:mitochondrial fission protein ELM1
MKVLFLKDDKPGHYNQTEGLLFYLREIFPNLEVEYIEVEIKSKFSRKILRFLLNNFSSFFERKSRLKYLSFFYKNYKLPKNNPDLIISTGGNVSNINAWFSKAYNCKNILNGALRGLKEELFTYVTTVIDLGYKNQIILDVAPSLITKEKLELAANKFLEEKKLSKEFIYYSLLIGGDGAGYKYDDKFYNDLIDFVKNISMEKNIKWLITTSRRTPEKIEEKLKNSLKDFCAYFVDYNNNPQKVMLPFLGLSEKIFVTEESSSMISEAILSEKDVITLRGKDIKLGFNYQKILDKFVTSNYIMRYKFDENIEKFISKKNNNLYKYKNILKDKFAK